MYKSGLLTKHWGPCHYTRYTVMLVILAITAFWNGVIYRLHKGVLLHDMTCAHVFFFLFLL